MNKFLAPLVFACVALASCGGGGQDPVAPTPPTGSTPTEIAAGAQLVSALKGTPVVGQVYSGRVVLLPKDRRNTIVGYRISSETASGSPPSIDSTGNVTWAPNEMDFLSTSQLQITAQLASGPDELFTVPVDVRKERTVLEASLPAAAGTLSDTKGRYLIKVEPKDASAPMSGTLRVVEIYSTNGAFRFSVRVPSTANALLTILDAPSPALTGLSAPTERRATLAASSAAKDAAKSSVETAAPGLEADIGEKIGGAALSGKHGLLANAGEVNVFTTRRTPFYYAKSTSTTSSVESPDTARVFQIDGSCTTSAECTRPRAPVILVHGFNPRQRVGGGDGTWGSLASVLKDNAPDKVDDDQEVFELRWITYMRFEEAAGVLATLSRRVAELTGKRPIIVAHSFGGIVAHLAAMGRGIEFDGTRWVAVPTNDVLARLITLGSPLSGIASSPHSSPFDWPVGVDSEDRSIRLCEAITCYQAGSDTDAYWDAPEIEEIVSKVAAIDAARHGMPGGYAGASIQTLIDAWRAGAGHSVPFATVVSIRRLPSEYDTPRTAHLFGDGLISMMGQAVEPFDFSDTPAKSGLDLTLSDANLGPDFMDRLEAALPSNMLRLEVRGRIYYFAIRASHNEWKDEVTFRQYPIAEFPADGKVRLVTFGTTYDHPLRHFIDHPTQLAAAPITYVTPGVLPSSIVSGRLLNWLGLPKRSEPISLQIEDALTGASVTDRAIVLTDRDSGVFTYNAGAELARRFPGTTLKLSDYQVVLRAGDGLGDSRVLVRQALSRLTDLGDIRIASAAETPLVSVAGRVIDGQTLGTPIPGADIYFMKGANQDEALVRSVTNTDTSRRVTANASGDFSIDGLEPGDYTVVVSKSGYFPERQGTIRLASTGVNVVSLSLLRVLADSDTAITLRWGPSSGVDVASDLDSHLRKYSASGGLVYHISYSSRTGSATDSLDRDDTDYEGPETITLRMDSTSRYVYFVHRYSFGGTLGGAGTTSVSVRIGRERRDFSLPAGETSAARYWKVFEIIAGRIVPCETGCLTDIRPD